MIHYSSNYKSTIELPINLSKFLSNDLITNISNYLSKYQYMYLFIKPLIYPFIYLINYPSIYTFSSIVITIWMIIETIFFPYYIYMFNKLQSINHNLNHKGSTKENRKKLVTNCFNALVDASSSQQESSIYIRKVLEGYFLDIPMEKIGRDNLAEWMSWAFFGKDFKTLSNDEREENYEYVSFAENLMMIKLSDGYISNLKAARLTLDPLFATQRPFFFYLVIYIVNQSIHILLRLLGYKKLNNYNSKAQKIYYRPGTWSNKQIKKPIPILFVHGIGIGFAHYLLLLWKFPTEQDIYLVEWPHVAMQFSSEVPSSNEVVDTLLRLFNDYKHDKVCLIGHSLGSTLVTWLLHHPIAKSYVSSTLLLDPVTFLLCDPAVATTFVYKDPVTTIDFLMHFFLSRELFIANALSRHFSWSENILFVEDLNDNSDPNFKINNTIVISLSDTIIPVNPIITYFKSKTKQGYNNFEVILFDGGHGEMFLYYNKVQILIDKIKQRCYNI